MTSSAVVGSSAITTSGSRGQRDGDHHALLLPAGHLERIVVDATLGLRNADALQPVDRLGHGRVAAERAYGAR